MDIWLTFLILIVFLFIAAFWNYIFPRCLCCKKSKPMFCFIAHNKKTLNNSFGPYRLICKKCSNKYYIKNARDLEELDKIKRKIYNNMDLE